MKKWIGIVMALSLVLAFSLPVYAQKAKMIPMGKEAADKMMETSMAKMKEMHEKMHKGEIQVDPAKMKKLTKDVTGVSKSVDEIQMKGF